MRGDVYVCMCEKTKKQERSKQETQDPFHVKYSAICWFVFSSLVLLFVSVSLFSLLLSFSININIIKVFPIQFKHTHTHIYRQKKTHSHPHTNTHTLSPSPPNDSHPQPILNRLQIHLQIGPLRQLTLPLQPLLMPLQRLQQLPIHHLLRKFRI